MYNIKTHSKSGTLFSKKKMSNKIERTKLFFQKFPHNIYPHIYILLYSFIMRTTEIGFEFKL